MAFATKIEERIAALKEKIKETREDSKERKKLEAKLVAEAKAEARAREKLLRETARKEKLDAKLEKIKTAPERKRKVAEFRRARFKADVKSGVQKVKKSLSDVAKSAGDKKPVQMVAANKGASKRQAGLNFMGGNQAERPDYGAKMDYMMGSTKSKKPMASGYEMMGMKKKGKKPKKKSFAGYW